ncbi:MAG: methylated-DNA--[protein]-cysteine S-methyltransferase [Streptococcaceae bacterium]|jgi:methylated-DNA-[protein]-cysteine S-methyltransferase|nr:methylated-DNA--[protein]-cysteine S-methyltransferase [Streptococcaceae bacterium]
MNYTLYHTPFATLHILEENNKILRITYFPFPYTLTDIDSPTLVKFKKQLDAYFSERTELSIPYQLPRTTTLFQERVFEAVAAIPMGETRTYQEIAHTIRSPKAQQAVGNALRNNPLVLLIPCHRVVGKAKRGGYLGRSEDMQAIKSKLLHHESRL